MDCKSEMELEWMVGVVGGRRVRRNLPEEAVEKEKTPWLVLHQCISGNEQVINQHKWNEKLEALSFEKKKNTHIEPKQNIPCWWKYKLIFAALYILQTTICECS